MLSCKHSLYNKTFKAVLNTDKQRTNEEVCTLLLACDGSILCYDYVTPLLQKHQNLPLQDVLHVMNHLFNSNGIASVVYNIIEVYSEYHDVYKAMINEMQAKPGFDKENLYWDPSKSVMAEVVKKYTYFYARK